MKIINIFDEINEDTYKDILEEIIKITKENRQIDIDNEKLPKEDREKKEDVMVNICSPGGNVYEGFAIVDALKNCGAKIITNALGYVGSMGFVIYMCGDERLAGENIRFMYHGCNIGGFFGNQPKIQDFSTEQKRINTQIKKFIAEQGCRIDEKILNKYIKNGNDYNFGYLEALKYNVITNK